MNTTSYFKTTCASCRTTYESSTARSKCTKCSAANESVRYITEDVEKNSALDITDQVDKMWRNCPTIIGMSRFCIYYSVFLYEAKTFLYDSKKAVIPNKQVTTADKAKYMHGAIKYLNQRSIEFIKKLASPADYGKENYPIADDIILEKRDLSWYQTEFELATIFEMKPFLEISIKFHHAFHKFLAEYRDKTEAELETDFGNITAKILRLAKENNK